MEETLNEVQAEETKPQLPKIPVDEQIGALFDVFPTLLPNGKPRRALNPWVHSTHSLDIVKLYPSFDWTLLAPDHDLDRAEYPWLKPSWHTESIDILDDEFDVRMRRDWAPFDLCVFAATEREAPMVLHRMASRARVIACLTMRSATQSKYLRYYEPEFVIDFNNAQNTAWLVWGDVNPVVQEWAPA